MSKGAACTDEIKPWNLNPQKPLHQPRMRFTKSKSFNSLVTQNSHHSLRKWPSLSLVIVNVTISDKDTASQIIIIIVIIIVTSVTFCDLSNNDYRPCDYSSNLPHDYGHHQHNRIGHFRITFGLFFKASPGAYPFIMK